MSEHRLDIVLPCFRPPEGWTDRIVEASKFLSQRKEAISHRIILVNDGTPGGVPPWAIQQLAESLPAFLFVDQQINQGKGAALRAGVEVATAPITIFTDIDFPYTFASLEKLYFALASDKTDVAIGIKDSSYYAHLPQSRVRISRFLRWLARTFLRISITDTQCGLKGFQAQAREVFLQTTISRYLADLEFIFLVDRRKELKMQAYEVKLREGVVFSKVNLRILMTEGWNFLKVFVRSFGPART
ncbi:MAG: glycosyltransferase family 2 protein [Bacteroidota bacterium]